MAIIALEGMHFYAYLGFYEEERIVGNQFVLDVYVDADIEEAADEDELYEEPEDEDTEKQPLSVNYEMVYEVCKREMYRKELSEEEIERRRRLPKVPGKIDDEYALKQPAKLLETIAKRIADRLHKQFDNVRGTKVRVKKISPPLGGLVDCAYVEFDTGLFKAPRGSVLKKLKNLVDGWDALEELDEK